MAEPHEVRKIADAAREQGIEITDCSFCVRHSPPKEAGPHECPFCGRLVEPYEDDVEGGHEPHEVRKIADAAREQGIEITGCSFCVRHSPPKEAGPRECPFCGRLVEPYEDDVEGGHD
jgi:predicted peroxiredoxin